MHEYGFRCKKCNNLEWDESTVNGWPCPVCKTGKMRHDIAIPWGYLEANSSLGGYTIIYFAHDYNTLTHGYDTLCANCAAAMRDAGNLRSLQRQTYDEGPPLNCELCNKEIESSYGDPGDE